jgi:hypothetical protein
MNLYPQRAFLYPQKSFIPPKRAFILSAAKDLCILLAVATLFTQAAHAQGCTQCLDSTRATPPAVQAAYRHAIYLLGGAGATLFIAGTLLIRRNR